MSTEKSLLKHEHIIDSGMIDVASGHEIYWIDWGNPAIKNPIFFLHGGPGAGVTQSDFDKFDPATQRVIFHDQRGSSRSTPFASTEHNTTDHLVADIDRLRQKFGFEKISLFGFSWGSTLALVYAIQNPEVVEKMLIGGIFLARQEDNEFYLGGGIKSHFPEVWDSFIRRLPAADSSQSIVDHYKQALSGNDEAVKKEYARAWMEYESLIAFMDYNPQKTLRELDDWVSESLAYLEAHYLLNGCFLEENYIIDNASKLRDIDIVIVHGRYDFICMPSAAIDLHKAIGGEKAILHVLMAGHDRSDAVSRETIKAYSNMLWRG